MVLPRKKRMMIIIIFMKRTYHGLLRLRWTSLHLLLLLLVLLMWLLLLWLLRLRALTHITTYLVHVDRLLSDTINTLILLPLVTALIKVTTVHIMVLSLVMLVLIPMTTSLMVHTTTAMVSIVLVMMSAVTMMLLVHHRGTSTTILATAHVLHVLSTTTTSVTSMSTVSVHMTAAPTSRAVLFSSSWRHFPKHYQRIIFVSINLNTIIINYNL